MKIDELEKVLNGEKMQSSEELESTKLLQKISLELIPEENTQILFEKIMDVVMQIMHSDYASLQMLHTQPEEGDKLQLLASRGFNPQAEKFWEWVYAEHAGSTCGEALRTGKRVIASNVEECDFMQGTEDLYTYLQTGIHAVQTTPLYSRSGKLVGMISTHWKETYDPLDQQLWLLDVLSRQVADLIEQVQYKEKFRENEEKYQALFEYMNEGFFLAELIYDDKGKPIDYLYLDANPAFEDVLGLKKKEILGKTRSETLLFPSIWIEIFGKVALTGQSTIFQGFSEGLNRHFMIKAFSPKLGQFACLIQDITEHKKAEDRIKWDKEKAEILYEVTEQLLLSNNPQEIVQELCIRVMKFLKCHTFFNYLIDEKKAKLHLNACEGIPIETAEEIKWLDFGVAVCGCVARDGCRIVAEKIQSTSDNRTDLVKSFGIRAYACHPLMYQNKVIGTLSFGTKSKDAFDSDELDLMKAVANQVSIAMNRITAEKRLIEQQQLIINAENEKRQALEKTLEMKDEFLSLISHELRTPLNVINTAVQAMQLICKDELSDKAKGYIKMIRQNMFRQLRLVNNLLDITRIDAGSVKIHKKNIDIVFLTNSIVKSVSIFASQKGVNIEFITSLTKKIIGIDEEKYERILLNLLSNAIKFTPEGKSVTVKMRSMKKVLCIEVIDTGIGIPEDKIGIIFERFGQIDSLLSRQAEGAGIGLSLVKRFIEALDGSISVKSKFGKGSNFTIILPNNKVLEESDLDIATDLMDDRLIQITTVEFSDIYL